MKDGIIFSIIILNLSYFAISEKCNHFLNKCNVKNMCCKCFFMSMFWDENLHFDQLDLTSGPLNSTGKTQGSVLSHCIKFLQIAGI